MTDHPGLPGPSPEQEAVRRLLADASHDGPTPPEVVARLDATLASLAAERETGHAPAPVVDLGARRRRMAGVALLAAAAVVVAGVAIGNGLPSTNGSSDSGSASAGDAGASQELGDASSGGSAAEDEMSQQQKTQLSPGLVGYPQLSLTDPDLDDELVLLRDSVPGLSAAGEPARTVACDVPGAGRGRKLAADLDGAPGLVVFRRADGATQRVDLYACGDPAVVRTITLPAP